MIVRLFLLFLFIFRYSSAATDCSCPSGYYPVETSSDIYTYAYYDYHVTEDCSQNSYSYDTFTNKTSTDSTNDYYYVTVTTYNCETCNEPDVDIVVPDGKVIQSINLEDTSQTGGCPILDTNKVNECLALPGGEVLTGKINCCSVYACVADMDTTPESNCTDPYVDDGNGNCVCDTVNGYTIDSKTDQCTDCPNTYVCTMSTDLNNGSFNNYYDVYDCNNVNYADAEYVESFNCFDTQCPPGQYFCDKSAQCQLVGSECLADGSDTNDSQDQTCDYPLTLYDDPFQGIMSTQDCLDHGGWTYSCTDWTVACYYKTDEDGTDPSAGNTDDTNTDANVSGTIDDGNVTSDVNMTIDLSAATTRLDTIIDSLSANGAIVKSIGDLSNSINNNMNDLKSAQDRTTDHIDGMNSNLGGKLDKTNELLEDIKDNQNPDLDIDTSNLDAAFGEAKTLFDDALLSFGTSANDFKSLITGTGLPTVSASGDCFLSGTAPHIGSYRIDFESLSYLRTGFQFLLNMFLLYLSIRLYTRIARDIVGYITPGL